jgi:hypothetical protein
MAVTSPAIVARSTCYGCHRREERRNVNHLVVYANLEMPQQAGFVTRREAHVFHNDSNMRADLDVENYVTGRACFDVTIVHVHSVLHNRQT